MPKPQNLGTRISALTIRMMRAFDSARIHPSVDLGHASLNVAAVMLEDQVTREHFLELAAAAWDLVANVESPVPPGERATLPERQAPLLLELLEEKAREIGRGVAQGMPEGAGFVLVLADFIKGGHMTYVSSVQRPGAIAMLKELVEKIQQGTH